MKETKTEDVERSCQAVSPNDEPCDYPAKLNFESYFIYAGSPKWAMRASKVVMDRSKLATTWRPSGTNMT